MRNLLYYLVIFWCVLVSGACSRFNGTRLETLLGGDVNLVSIGEDAADTLVKRSVPPLLPRQPDQPILITTLVNEHKLEETSAFARTLQNHIASRFTQYGYAVKEIRMRHNLVMRPGEGEFMLSRHLDRIVGREKAQAVVLGTYSLAGRIMYLSVRLVNPVDRTIRSSWDQRLALDDNSLRLLGLKLREDQTIVPPAQSWLDTLLY